MSARTVERPGGEAWGGGAFDKGIVPFPDGDYVKLRSPRNEFSRQVDFRMAAPSVTHRTTSGPLCPVDAGRWGPVVVNASFVIEVCG